MFWFFTRSWMSFLVVWVENSMGFPGLPGGLIIDQGHLFPLKGRNSRAQIASLPELMDLSHSLGVEPWNSLVAIQEAPLRPFSRPRPLLRGRGLHLQASGRSGCSEASGVQKSMGSAGLQMVLQKNKAWMWRMCGSTRVRLPKDYLHRDNRVENS